MGGLLSAREGVRSEPNVIPMIDILLVLLVVFMIVNLRVRHVIDTQVPPPVAASRGPAPTQIVLELLPGTGYAINGQLVPEGTLGTTIGQIYAERPAKLLFVKAAPDRTYQEVIGAMDQARGAAVQTVALVPR
jgi:biopolymer transport protein ExbD